jgi:selenocysteine lyase/cysteine desulfurase
VTFLVKDSKATAERLRKANIELTLRFGNQMRIAVSVFNSAEDVDRLLRALA